MKILFNLIYFKLECNILIQKYSSKLFLDISLNVKRYFIAVDDMNRDENRKKCSSSGLKQANGTQSNVSLKKKKVNGQFDCRKSKTNLGEKLLQQSE